jgi:hypothetical protein
MAGSVHPHAQENSVSRLLPLANTNQTNKTTSSDPALASMRIDGPSFAYQVSCSRRYEQC